MRAIIRSAPSPPCHDTPRAFPPPPCPNAAPPLSRLRPPRLLPARVLPPATIAPPTALPIAAPPPNAAPACEDPPKDCAPGGKFTAACMLPP